MSLYADTPHRDVTTLGKRAFDVVLSALMIVTFAPLMLTIAALIRLSGSGPIFFKHGRVGRDGVIFPCLKFRTMRPDAEEVLESVLQEDPSKRQEWEEFQKLEDDPRIIPLVGTFLRASSLDELPQLFNVFFGHMSMVGPRPVTEDELTRYGHYRGHYLRVRPGLTGAWQIGGRSETSYDDRVQMDVWYVENASLGTDASIFAQTVASFVTGRLSGGR